MDVAETAYVCVRADRLWNDSGVDIAPGQIYNFTVPTSEKWRDWRRPCDADGYRLALLLRPWEVMRRVPEANWLQLVATVGRSTRSATVVGSGMIGFSSSFPGRLYFFANCLIGSYWTNKGVIAVRVRRTK
jgi:hypothetical protein